MTVLRRFLISWTGAKNHTVTVFHRFSSQLSTMPEHALKKGDSLPPVTKDVMRFYNMRFCPFAQRTRMVLLHKNIPHEMVNVNLRHKPDWLFARNPLGLVPVLEYQNQVIYESRICDEYLEDQFPDSGNGRLYTGDASHKALDNMLMYDFDTKVPVSIYGVLNPAKSVEARGKLAKGLEILEKALGDKKFFGGDRPSMVDFHVFPWFERFEAVSKISEMVMPANEKAYNPLPPSQFPHLHTWQLRFKEVPAVKQTLLPTDHHIEFMMKLKMKQPEYDIGLAPLAARL